jgi:uncharacterized membrane protein YhaH (DUF805 family)
MGLRLALTGYLLNATNDYDCRPLAWQTQHSFGQAIAEVWCAALKVRASIGAVLPSACVLSYIPSSTVGASMNWGHYLFSFSGRINRAKMWLFVLLVIVFEIVSFAVVLTAFGLGHIQSVIQHREPPTALTGNAVALAVCALVGLAFLVLIFSGFAVVVKRLHDRNKSAWWLLVFYFVPALLNGYRISTVLSAMQNGGMPYNVNPLGVAAGGIAALIALWAFVEIYCLPGTAGDNAYGSDPLAMRT